MCVLVQALSRSGKLRHDIFITTKIHPQDLGYHPTMAAFENSLTAFSTEYMDLVLLHYANCFGSLCSTDPKGTWRESWRALEDLVREGRLLAIGVLPDALAVHSAGSPGWCRGMQHGAAEQDGAAEWQGWCS